MDGNDYIVAGNLVPISAQAFTEKVNYVALGDSLAAGQTPDKKIDKGYTGILAEALGKQNALASYSNLFAKSGYTTQNVLDDLVNNKEVDGKKIQDVVKSAQFITISAGGNDLIQAATIDMVKGSVTIAPSKALEVAKKIESNLTSILKSISELNPSAKVYISGYYNILPYLPAEQQVLVKQVISALNGIIQKVANENKANFVSLDGVFDADLLKYLPNKADIHPSLDGYQVIADAYLKAFTTAQISFNDVPESHWAYKEITLLIEGKVLKGTSETEFGPEKAVTRAEAAQAMFKMIPLDKSKPSNPGFNDIRRSMKPILLLLSLPKLEFLKRLTNSTQMLRLQEHKWQKF